jgi:hypothetical protein
MLLLLLFLLMTSASYLLFTLSFATADWLTYASEATWERCTANGQR